MCFLSNSYGAVSMHAVMKPHESAPRSAINQAATNEFYEFVRTNAEQRWDREMRRIVEPAIARCSTDPTLLDDNFPLFYTAVLAWGPERISEIGPRVAALIEPAIAARRAKRSKEIVVLGVANLANLLACCGYRDETAPFGEWLSEVETSSRDESTADHWDRGFAALALNRVKLYRALAGVDPDQPLQWAPSAGFGGNMQGFLRHLGAAVETGAPFAAIEPAWRDFVANLNRHEQVRQIGRETPFWIARVVHHRIGGAPLGSVAQWLHEQVKNAA